MDSKGLCAIIETCAKNKVLDFVMGDVRISFAIAPEQIMARESARPVVALGSESEVRDIEQQDAAEIEDQIEAEREAYLLAADPLEYEKLMLKRGEDEDNSDSK